MAIIHITQTRACRIVEEMILNRGQPADSIIAETPLAIGMLDFNERMLHMFMITVFDAVMTGIGIGNRKGTCTLVVPKVSALPPMTFRQYPSPTIEAALIQNMLSCGRHCRGLRRPIRGHKTDLGRRAIMVVIAIADVASAANIHQAYAIVEAIMIIHIMV